MAKVVYEKPKMTFVSLQNENNVAATCWGNHGKDYKYYDTAGSGYLAFTVTNGSCSAQYGFDVYFYEDKNDKEPDQLFEGDPRYDELWNKVVEASGGNYGSPFKGEDQFPNSPAGMS